MGLGVGMLATMLTFPLATGPVALRAASSSFHIPGERMEVNAYKI